MSIHLTQVKRKLSYYFVTYMLINVQMQLFTIGIEVITMV